MVECTFGKAGYDSASPIYDAAFEAAYDAGCQARHKAYNSDDSDTPYTIWSDTVEYGCQLTKHRLEITDLKTKEGLFADQNHVKSGLLDNYEIVLSRLATDYYYNIEANNEVKCVIDYLLDQKLVSSSLISDAAPHYTSHEDL